ncbi:MAG: hypothetical protein ACYSTL_06105, partial [Planctomycetota bacterium]
MAILLGIRPLSSPDIGYHLAYGEQFLETGCVVDTNEFIYTLPAEGDERPEAGPACWYDESGRYRFPNANWGSQVIFAAVHRWSGAVGLCTLQAGLLAAIFLMMLLTMLRLGVPTSIAAGGVFLGAMTAYLRFNLRPELFGYLLLVAQFYLLTSKRPTWVIAASLVLLQVVFVNLHSYFLLGLGMTGAFLVDRALRLLWWKVVRRQTGEQVSALRRDATILGAALLAQAVMCFVNPWGWRLAALPIQTMVFIHANDIAGSSPAGQAHPWAWIGEFFGPFAGKFVEARATYSYCAVLVLAGLGTIAAMLRRRWAWLFVIGGMTLISLSMRRNIAPAAMLITPAALGSCIGGVEFLKKLPNRLKTNLALITSSAVLAAALWFSFTVVTQRFYFAERSPTRFGVGIDRVWVPMDAAKWVS